MTLYPRDELDLRSRSVASPFAAVLQRVLRELRRRRDPLARIRQAWESIAGTLADCTDVLGYEHGVLRVGVAHAPVLAELRGFQAQSLLQQLQATPHGADCTELHFSLMPRKEQ